MNLNDTQLEALNTAEAALKASERDTDPANHGKNLGRLEVRLADMIRLVKELQGS